jgi:hypothetical protein
MPSDRAWLSQLASELKRQRQAITALLDLSEASALVSSLSVGCSIGRGAADALSDVDAAIGVHASPGAAGADSLRAVEESVIELLPDLGTVVDMLRSDSSSGDFLIRRLFVQLTNRLQLDLAVVAEDEVRRGEAAPDFVAVYWSGARPTGTRGLAAHEVSAEQVREWSFLGWRALLDADKYLRRGSPWEAHSRLHEARDRIWMLWAAAHHAAYPWHGLSQVLDHDPRLLPPGIEATVAGLELAALRRAVVASVDVLDRCSAAAAQARRTEPATALAQYARAVVTAN